MDRLERRHKACNLKESSMCEMGAAACREVFGS
jgi:hypothetical protein